MAGSRVRGRLQHGGAAFGFFSGRKKGMGEEVEKEREKTKGLAREVLEVPAMLREQSREHEVAATNCVASMRASQRRRSRAARKTTVLTGGASSSATEKIRRERAGRVKLSRQLGLSRG